MPSTLIEAERSDSGDEVMTRSRPALAVGGLHLLTLWAFAVVQPLFDLLGRNAQFFVARGSTAGDIWLLALGLMFVPPAVMLLVVWAAGRIAPAVGWALHLLLLGLLVALVVLPVAGSLLGGSSIALALAFAVGAGAAALYARARGIRAFLTVVSPAPVLFLGLFLLASPVSKIVFPDDASAAAAGPARSETPVVFVIFDELPLSSLLGSDERIDAERFPNFARLARRGTWYRNATTVADGTTEAVPALLTGDLPEHGEIPIVADHPHSLFTLLARSHEFHVIEPQTDLCPENLCGSTRPGTAARVRSALSDLRVVSLHLLLPEDMRVSLPPIDRSWGGFDDERLRSEAATDESAIERHRARLALVMVRGGDDPVADFDRLTDSLRSGGSRPPLAFLHVLLPHVPWRFLSDGTRYPSHRETLPGIEGRNWAGGQWLANQGFQRHLLQLAFADRKLGEVIERLEELGMFDDSLIVVAADHGVSFRNGHGRRAAARGNLADIASVPLIVKSPGQARGVVDDAAVRTVDVLPTVAQELGIALPWDIDGVPAGERSDDPDQPIAVSHYGETEAELPFGQVVRQRGARDRYEEALLGPRHDIYAIGPRPELVGREVDELAGARRVPTELDGDGKPSAYVSGRVTGLAPGDEVAVAVGGTVRATTRVRREDGELVFAAMVPPSALRGRVAVLDVHAP
jgi:hypothetical protein